MIIRVILAVDQDSLEKVLDKQLSKDDVIVDKVKGKHRLWERISRGSGDLFIISKSRIPDPISDMIKLLRGLPDSPWIVLLTDNNDQEERAHFLSAGCETVLDVSLSPESLKNVLEAIIVKRRDLADKGLPIRRVLSKPKLSDFVSNSPAMQTFMDMVRRVVSSNVSLLILGETGVGKERLARAIHHESLRSGAPFIAVNCGALPESLMESELFGHEEGSFTGATRSRRGCFELAHRGTVFLDEIGEIPYHLQVKLLRVLQEYEIQRVGSERTIKVDVRIIASTNRDIVAEVENNRFRRDLYYRLGVITLTIPPLRERREDISELTYSYIDYFRPRIGCDVDGITDESMEALYQYTWPGNVRELINVIERAMLLCNGRTITLDDLPESISHTTKALYVPATSFSGSNNNGTISESLLKKPLREVRQEIIEELERVYLAGLLRMNSGRIGQTANQAGIEPRFLYEKMKKYGLRKEDYK